jgi:RNA polymerase sigma-70 factor, ECF subfamily
LARNTNIKDSTRGWTAMDSSAVSRQFHRQSMFRGAALMNQTPAVLSVAELIRLVAAGSQNALKRIYEIESRRLYGIALRIARRPEIADDVLQDAFVQVWSNAAGFDPNRGAAEAWLTGIVRYRALDAVRRTRREDLSGDPGLGDSAEFTDPGELIDLETAAPALRRCLELLDESQRRCILLSYVDGLSQAEIALHIRSPLGTVKSWMRRALTSLRGCLDS